MTELSRTRGRFHRATTTVHGVATSRMLGDDKAAQGIIEVHLTTEIAEGISLSQSWAMLFSAAVVAFTDRLDEEAEFDLDGSSPLQLLSEIAIDHAASAELAP